MRSKRFKVFEKLVANLPRPLRIIDVGGTVGFWEQRGWAGRNDYEITLVNLSESETRYDNIRSRVGDATHLKEYSDRSFHVAFSNSVIEHLFTLEHQKAMAVEVRRVAQAYWVQTPNYWFPLEPHFHVPAWQWLPEGFRVALLRRMRCGRRGPYPDRETALEAVREIRLMTRRELAEVFPEARLWPERVAGLVKSWVAYGGFPD